MNERTIKREKRMLFHMKLTYYILIILYHLSHGPDHRPFQFHSNHSMIFICVRFNLSSHFSLKKKNEKKFERNICTKPGQDYEQK